MILLQEFLADLKSQCIILMGLPASGKSTFIQKELKKYFPGIGGFSTINSDNQVKQLQYMMAKQDWQNLFNLYKDYSKYKNNNDLDKFEKLFKIKSNLSYIDNKGQKRELPITFDWFIDKKDLPFMKSFSEYWNSFFKPFYATYFDIRDIAKTQTEKLFNTKIYKKSNILIIDTVASKPNEIQKKMQQTKNKNYNNTIIYLDIPSNLCIVRDSYREKTQGRGVGEDVIYNYETKMDAAYTTYKSWVLHNENNLDRLMHFKWKQLGDSPIKGYWVLIKDIKNINNKIIQNEY